MSRFGIFGSRNRGNNAPQILTDMSPRAFLDLARQTNEYRILSRETTADCADLTVTTIWARLKNSEGIYSDNRLDHLVSTRYSPDYYRRHLVAYLACESRLVQASMQHLEYLLYQTYTNIAVKLETIPGNQIPPAQYGAQGIASYSTKAAKWICSGSNTIGHGGERPADENAIARTIYLVLQRNMDLCSVATAEFVNKAVVKSVPINCEALRWTNAAGVKYSGIGGGSYLQTKVAELARRIRTSLSYPDMGGPMLWNRHYHPGNTHFVNKVRVPEALEQRLGRNNWHNLACFLLGGYLRAHGFAEGNGRTARVLFACAWIKGGGEFIAPTFDFEKNELSGL